MESWSVLVKVLSRRGCVCVSFVRRSYFELDPSERHTDSSSNGELVFDSSVIFESQCNSPKVINEYYTHLQWPELQDEPIVQWPIAFLLRTSRSVVFTHSLHVSMDSFDPDRIIPKPREKGLTGPDVLALALATVSNTSRYLRGCQWRK